MVIDNDREECKGKGDVPQMAAGGRCEGMVEAASGAQQAGPELREGTLELFVAFFPSLVSTLNPLLGPYFLVWHQTCSERDASQPLQL